MHRLAWMIPLFGCALARGDIAAPDVAPLPLRSLPPAPAPGGRTLLGGARGPFLDVRWVEDRRQSWVSYYLLVRTAAGWFRDELDGRIEADPPRNHLFVGPPRVDVQGSVLLLRVGQAIWKRDYALRKTAEALPEYACHELLVACAVDAAGIPGCSSPLPVADRRACDDADARDGGDWASRRWDFRLAAEVRQPDRLILRVANGRPRPRVRVGAETLAVVVGELRLQRDLPKKRDR